MPTLSTGQQTCDHCNVVLPSTSDGGLCGRCAASPLGECTAEGLTCESCGYELTGLIVGDRCPECRTQIAGTTDRSEAQLAREADEAAGFGIAAAVLAVTAMLGVWCAWPLLFPMAFFAIARARAVRLGHGPARLPARLRRAMVGTTLAWGSLVGTALYITYLIVV